MQLAARLPYAPLMLLRSMGLSWGDGRVALELKTAWHDGTRELVFDRLEFLERLAAMTPRPETNLLICHGVLAPRARWRGRVVVYGRRVPEPTASPPPLAAGPDGTAVKTASPRAWSGAALMHRANPPTRTSPCGVADDPRGYPLRLGVS